MCEEFIFASQIYNEDILKNNSIPKMMKNCFNAYVDQMHNLNNQFSNNFKLLSSNE